MTKLLPILLALCLLSTQVSANFKDFILSASSLANRWVTGFKISDLKCHYSKDFKDPLYVDFSIDKFIETNNNLKNSILGKDEAINLSLEFLFLKNFYVEDYVVFTYYKTFGSYVLVSDWAMKVDSEFRAGDEYFSNIVTPIPSYTPSGTFRVVHKLRGHQILENSSSNDDKNSDGDFKPI